MKIYNKFAYALMALSMLAVSCVEEETFKPGEEDNADCYGVFFPEQECSGFHEWDPANPSELVVKVSRKVATDAISVPIDVVTSDSIWVCPKAIQFAKGQTDTSFVIKFEDAVLGQKYDGLTVEINDPKYASKYSSNASFFTFSVQKVKWNTLDGNAIWHEGFLTALFGCDAYDLEVLVQERDDLPGMFRFKNVYGADYPENGPGDYDENDVWLTIDASDSSRVDMAYQPMGIDWGWGPMYAGSTYQLVKMATGYTDEKMETEYDISTMLGTYDKINNVISFAEGSTGMTDDDVDPREGYWYDTDAFYIVLPGGKLVDYSISMKAYETEEVEGENCVPVEIVTGVDVDSVKYTVLQGLLTKSQFEDEAAAIIRGTAEGIEGVEADPEEGVVVFYTDTTTAMYTIVAVTFDAEGNAQEYDRAEFGFVKAGDEIPVAFGASFASMPGYTDDASLVFSVFGKDLTEIKVGTFIADEMTASQEAYYGSIEKVIEGESLPAGAIELANTTGYTALIKKLLPGTQYILVVYVFNGYRSDYVLLTEYTSGEPKKIYNSWSEPDWDMMDEAMEVGAEYYYGTYNYYARRLGHHDDDGEDYIDDYNDALRTFCGQVKIEDADPELFPTEGPDPDGGYDDYVQVTGLMSPFAEYYGACDTLIFDVYEGWLYNCGNCDIPVWENDGYNFRFLDIDLNDGVFSYYSSILAFAEEGYLSYFNVDDEQEYSAYTYIMFDADEPDDYSDSYIVSPLLVDPEIDEETAPAAVTSAKSSAKASSKVFKPVNKFSRLNYVETERGMKKSAIDRLKAKRGTVSVKSDFTPVNDVVVPAQRAAGQTRVEIVRRENAAASAGFTRERRISAGRFRR